MTSDPAAAKDRSPPAGWLEGATHVFPLRVYYEDTDFSGVVYHASYLRFMERGRSEFLRTVGAGHRGLLAAPEPLAWAVRRMSIEFVRPARVEDALLVRTILRDVKGARMQLEQLVNKGAELLIRAEVEACVITLDGRPRRVPDAIRKTLESFRQDKAS